MSYYLQNTKETDAEVMVVTDTVHFIPNIYRVGPCNFTHNCISMVIVCYLIKGLRLSPQQARNFEIRLNSMGEIWLKYV